MLLFLNLLPKHNYTVFVTYKHTTLKNDEQWRPLSTGGVSGTACVWLSAETSTTFKEPQSEKDLTSLSGNMSSRTVRVAQICVTEQPDSAKTLDDVS